MKNSTICIICAMDKEMQHYHEIFKDCDVVKYMNYDFFITSYNTNKIIFTKCGIGKVNAASLTTIIADHFSPDLIINTGVAGGYDKSLKPLDIVSATQVFHHDVDCCFGIDLRRGQVQDLPLTFRTSILLNDRIAKLDYTIKFGSIATGDEFVTDYKVVDEKVKKYYSDLDVMAFDMESAAIGQVCYLNHIEFLIIRAMSDIIGENNIDDYNNFAVQAANKAAKLVLQLIELD